MEEYIIIGLLGVILVLELYKILKKDTTVDPTEDLLGTLKEEYNEMAQLLLKEFSSIRLETSKDSYDMKAEITKSIHSGLKDNTKDLNEFKENLTTSLSCNFSRMNARIEEQMERINKRVELRLDEGFDKTNRTFTNIVERLTKIDEAQKNIDRLSTEVVSLQHLLSDKKTRGTFGEVQLNHILSAIFGENNQKVYNTQQTLSNGKIVDALIHLPDEMGNLAIDSKFPLENYRRMVNREFTDRERDLSKRAFKQDMKKHIDEISTKYIIPNETSDQAVLFVPAEAIFAEINAYHDEIVEYANNKRVWIASPTTLMSLLTTVQVLLRNVERDKYAKIIQEELVNLGTEFNRYQERWDKLNKQIDTVSKSVKEVHTTSKKIGKRFNEISTVNLDKKEIDSSK